MKKEIDLISLAKESIWIEIQALQQLRESIDDHFLQAIHHIYQAKGKLIITGIGKSAIVGQKIVATLNSTGTSALFMHAADAIHGDLGMIQNEDTVCCISKSGETEEIKVLIPLVKSLGGKLIAMVSNKNSYLAQQADYVLWTPVQQEADPNNLAPTASTTSQMAMGDAMAICLLSLKGFSAKDFAQFHPGGSLGKQLYLTVGQMIEKNEKPFVYAESSLKEVIVEISSKRLGMTAVIDDQKKVIGIITDGDLRRMLQKDLNFNEVKAKDIMTKQAKIIQKDEMAVFALTMMRENNISQLIVEEQFNYAGVIHIHDLIKEGIV